VIGRPSRALHEREQVARERSCVTGIAVGQRLGRHEREEGQEDPAAEVATTIGK